MDQESRRIGLRWKIGGTFTAASADGLASVDNGRTYVGADTPAVDPGTVSVFASNAQTNGFDVRIQRPHTTILASYGTQQGYRNAVARITHGAARVWFIGSHGRLDVLEVERALYQSGYRAAARRGHHEAWFLSLWVKAPA